MDNVLTIEKLDIGYDKKLVNNIDLKVNEKDLIAFLAPNNAGKSTLLNLLGGLDSVTSGQIIVNDEHVESFDDNQLTTYRAKNVGFIFKFY